MHKKMTFFQKISAWWREEYKFGESLLTDKNSDTNNTIKTRKDNSSSDQKHKVPLEPIIDPTIWTKERIDICRDFWEEDFSDEIISFEAPRFAVGLASYLNLSPGTTVLDMFSGIGGVARLIAKKLDLWVTCMETEKILVDMSNLLSKNHDLEKKVASVLYDPATLTLSNNKYVACLLRERFHSVENKLEFLQKIPLSLQDGGHLIITDFVANNLEHEDVVFWKNVSSYKVHLWTEEEYIDAIQSIKLRFHVKQNQSDEILNRFDTQFKKFSQNFSTEEQSPNTLRYIENELLQWSALHKVLKNGHVRYIRFHASKI